MSVSAENTERYEDLFFVPKGTKPNYSRNNSNLLYPFLKWAELVE
jgi:hypothetical protein